MFNGVVRTLSDVTCPRFKRNLYLFLSILYLKGYKYASEGGVLKVNNGALVVMKGVEKVC